MKRLNTILYSASTLLLLVLTVTSTIAIEPCEDSTGVLGGFPRAFCVIDAPVGDLGGLVNINVQETTVRVPDNPGGTDDLDVFVLLANEITAPPAMAYTTTFGWETPADPSGLVFREWVGNFNFSPPRATQLTYVNAPVDEIRPAEFSWILNGAGLATGATVGTGSGTETAGWRNVDGLPSDLPALERYHFQIAGLPADTDVTFTKNVVGGQVVPEPTSGVLTLLAVGLSGLLRRRR